MKATPRVLIIFSLVFLMAQIWTGCASREEVVDSENPVSQPAHSVEEEKSEPKAPAISAQQDRPQQETTKQEEGTKAGEHSETATETAVVKTEVKSEEEEKTPLPAESETTSPPETTQQEAESNGTAESSESDTFSVSEEVYTETFQDIRTLIQQLNTVIQKEDYTTWQTFLSRDYIDHFSNAEVLRNASDQPLLRKYNIRLRSLKDYFTYVVVPSRSNARLDDLVFVDTEHLKAIMIINGQRTILYSLTKRGDIWKIGL